METNGIVKEVEDAVEKLMETDASSKEYTILVNNIAKLHQVTISNKDFELKENKNAFDDALRIKQFELEKDKFKSDVEQKALTRELDAKRLEYQHEERMAEIKVNQMKAENEKKILEQNQIREEREFKSNRRRDWITFGGKCLMLLAIVGLNVLMHKDELSFEREENGIVPRRCGTYNTVVGRASEMVMR